MAPWSDTDSLVVRAMALTPSAESDAGKLFVAGPLEKDDDPFAPYQGRGEGRPCILLADDGQKVTEMPLPAQPVFDGMAAAGGRLFLALTDGRIVCLGRSRHISRSSDQSDRNPARRRAATEEHTNRKRLKT
jgi:hypothetical protein